ncbi:DUF4296 domain-containing protein [Thermaurantimonas aggregans]|uniref:DUF4296 domain-containing protein n=1 Tax=Thermaurantimonas aggregans TaxID=2173829 RepID=UPI000F579811|nr:DUF4296 domain-containing protein [Thermaurantimonas aggregans]
MNRFKFFNFFHLGVRQAWHLSTFAARLAQARSFCAFAIGLAQARSFCAFAWVGVFRGPLRSRASAVQALPSHRPTLRFGRTPSTSRWSGARSSVTYTPHRLANLNSLNLLTILIILHLVATSCVRVEVPPDVLDREAMAALLADIHQLEGRRVGDRVLYAENAYMKDYYTRIFEKHCVTDEQYRRSHYFYTQYPDLFSQVYDRTIEILQKKQIESENVPNPSPQAPDEGNF